MALCSPGSARRSSYPNSRWVSRCDSIQVLYDGPDMPLRIEQDGEDVRLWVKAVPGASRDQVAGVIGERLKVKVSAPPEGGKANQAICRLIAKTLGVKPGRVAIETGMTSAEKIVRVTGMTIDEAAVLGD